MPNRFVILTNGRSGSTMLVDLLKSHPDIYCEPEVFNEFYWKRSQYPLLWLLRAYPIPYLNWRVRRNKKAVYGFKLKTGGQIFNLAHCVKSLHQQGWQLIYLYRKDIFQQTISWSVAEASRRWHTTSENGYSAQTQITLDVGLFLRHLQTSAKDRKFLSNMMRDLPNLGLVYEDDLDQPEHLPATILRLCDFLSVPQLPLHSKFVRTWDRPYRDLISNYDELLSAVEKSSCLNPSS